MIERVGLFSAERPHFSTDGRYAGVRALWLKVVVRAVFDWVSYREAPKLLQRKLAESAYNWLFKPSEVFNSFENICYYLDMDPEIIRRWALQLDREQVAKIELLDRLPASCREKNSLS